MATKKNSQKTQLKITTKKKTVSKSKAVAEKANRRMRVTIYFGYGLFFLTLIGTLWGYIIPMMFRLYPAPFLDDSRITLALFTFAFTALAPPLVGYLAGDAATRGKSKILHHYNGVLFGVLGVWVWFCASLASSTIESVFMIVIESNIQDSLLRMAPAGVAAIVTIILGIFYARATRHRVSLIDYAPYRWALIISAIGLVIALAATSISGLNYGGGLVMSLLINLITPSLFLLVGAVFGYWILGRKTGTTGERMVYALVGIAYGIVAGTVMAQFSVFGGDLYQQLIAYEFVAIIGVWVAYLYLLRRASR